MTESEPDRGTAAAGFGPFGSIWQFLDATVLIAVERGTGAVMAVPSESGDLAVVHVDLARMQSLLPDRYEIKQSPVATLLRELPGHLGLVVEIASPAEVRVDRGGRERLLGLTVPFPAGAYIAWGEAPPGVAVLRRTLLDAVAARSDVSALWLARFQVEDARERLAIVYRVLDGADDATFVDDVYAVVADVAPSYPVQVIAESDLAPDTRRWLNASVTPLIGADEEPPGAAPSLEEG